MLNNNNYSFDSSDSLGCSNNLSHRLVKQIIAAKNTDLTSKVELEYKSVEVNDTVENQANTMLA